MDFDLAHKEILDADTVRFILKLKDEPFSNLKPKLLTVTEIKVIFKFNIKGELPLKDFKNYEHELYGTTTEIE